MAEENLTLDEILRLADKTSDWEYIDHGGWSGPIDPYFSGVPQERFVIKISTYKFAMSQYESVYKIECMIDKIPIGVYSVLYEVRHSQTGEELREGDSRIKELFSRVKSNYDKKKKSEYEEWLGNSRKEAERERIGAVRIAKDLLK